MNIWRKEGIEMTVRNTFKAEFNRTGEALEASNKTIDEVFAKFGNLSEQELNIVRNGLVRKIDQYTKQFETIGK
jgi:hypothetical protein